MYNIDQDVSNAVLAAIKNGTNWFGGMTSVTRDGDNVEVSYRANKIFGVHAKTGKWWMNDCGWPTRTTRNRINDCFKACNFNFETYLSKGQFCIRNTTNKVTWICGDGKITEDEVEKHTVLTAEKFFS